MITGVLENQPSPGNIGCVFPMGASVAEVIAEGFDGRLTLTNNQQTGTLITEPGTAVYGMLPINPDSPIGFDIDAGLRVVEFELSLQYLGGVASGTLASAGLIVNSSGQSIVSALIRHEYDDAEAELAISALGHGLLYSAFLGAGVVSVIIGFEFDAGAGTFRAILDGAGPLSLSANTYTPAANVVTYGLVYQTNLEPSDAGKVAVVTARTDAANITGSYAMGATDVCGNAL